jgi:uncharacterized protein (DUF934 family)
MRIVRNQQVVEDDFIKLDAAAPLPATGKLIVPLERWRAEKETLKARGGVGVAIPSSLDVAELKDDLPAIEAIVVSLVFIKPKPEGGLTFDGRAYSQARLLRERFGYQGEIRAVGEIFRDTMHMLHRCGVNAFEPRAGLAPEEALKAFAESTLAYQSAADGQPSIFRRRLA